MKLITIAARWKLEKKKKKNQYTLSWPPRSSTAWTKRAWRVVVHRILGALMLRLAGNLEKNLERPMAVDATVVVSTKLFPPTTPPPPPPLARRWWLWCRKGKEGVCWYTGIPLMGLIMAATSLWEWYGCWCWCWCCNWWWWWFWWRKRLLFEFAVESVMFAVVDKDRSKPASGLTRALLLEAFAAALFTSIAFLQKSNSIASSSWPPPVAVAVPLLQAVIPVLVVDGFTLGGLICKERSGCGGNSSIRSIIHGAIG